MKNRRALILIAALLLTTALAAIWHLSAQPKSVPGQIAVSAGGSTRLVAFDSLPASAVRGEIVNGKGEALAIDAAGISLADALEHARVDVGALDRLTVVASDEYRAELTGSEVRQPDKAWLIFQEDGGLRLIVFGDPDSKRNVSDVARMEVQ